MILSENVIEEFYAAVARNDNEFIYSVHIPMSDVFYVREAIHQSTGKRYTLDYIEWAMLKEGVLQPHHCFNATEKLLWEEYPFDKEVV